jgi:membrane protease YdiL (CAAX protease family)
VFAAMREWRGSLVAPIVAHALNNTMLIVAWCSWPDEVET